MRQQTYDPSGPEEDALEEYARRLAAPGALHAGIEYFRAHQIDAAHNREHAETRLPMAVLTVGGTASFGANLEGGDPAARGEPAQCDDQRVRPLLAEEKTEQIIEELRRFFQESV